MKSQPKPPFDELVKYLIKLSTHDWEKLKTTVENQRSKPKISTEEFKELLLRGPVATKADLKRIKKNRKALNALWRIR